jgi:hypothetical protein
MRAQIPFERRMVRPLGWMVLFAVGMSPVIADCNGVAQGQGVIGVNGTTLAQVSSQESIDGASGSKRRSPRKARRKQKERGTSSGQDRESEADAMPASDSGGGSRSASSSIKEGTVNGSDRQFRPVRLALVNDNGFVSLSKKQLGRFKHLETVDVSLLELTQRLNPGYVVENAIWARQSLLRLLSRTYSIDVLVSMSGSSDQSGDASSDSDEEDKAGSGNVAVVAAKDAQDTGNVRFLYFADNGEILRRDAPIKKLNVPRISMQILRDLGFNGVIRRSKGKRFQIESLSGKPFRVGETGAVTVPSSQYVYGPYSPRVRSRALFQVIAANGNSAVAEVTFQVDQQLELREGDLVWVGPEPGAGRPGG